METPPTSVKVTYSVSSGNQPYVEITTDGDTKPLSLTGPVEETVEVTGTWTIASWLYDAITVTVDGKEQEFAVDGSTIPTVTVDFNAYLEQWYADHPSANKVPAADGASGEGSGGSQTQAAA